MVNILEYITKVVFSYGVYFISNVTDLILHVTKLIFGYLLILAKFMFRMSLSVLIIQIDLEFFNVRYL